MRIVYAYNSEGYFVKTVEQNLDELTKQYPPVVFGTITPVPNYNANLEIPKFVNDAWELEDLKEVGTFYLKTDATEVVEIAKKEANLYTELKPLKKYNDGTTQVFNNISNVWEYTFKGVDRLKEEEASALQIAKNTKLQMLRTAFNISKKITIQNGNTLIIEHNTPERNIFLDKLTNVLQESLSQNVSLSYQQQVGNVMYRFSALPIIWSYIFKDLFLVENKSTDGSLTGFKQNIREYNRITFEVVALKIQNTTTIEELNAISWEFTNPNGIFIDVNEKATKMLNDPSFDNFTKSVIEKSKDPNTGQIHLINIVE